MNKTYTAYKIFGFSVFLGILFLGLGSHVFADTPNTLGSDFPYSAGAIQTVPPGYALTAIGYGSDDWKCMLKIKTAPVNPDGSVDFTQADQNWQVSNCPTTADGGGGAPGPNNAGFEKYFEPTPGYVVTGWSWGADTSGGSPDTDSFPPDECVYQEYMNLRTGATFTWGQPNTGTCADRQYNDISWLKNVIRAPAGRVIIGIGFNLDQDAQLSFLAETTRDVTPTATISASVNPIQVCSATTGDATITAQANVNWEVHVNSPTGQLFMSGGADASASSDAPWLTDGMVLYVTNASTGAVLNTLTISFTNSGCPPPAPTATLSVTPSTVQVGNNVNYAWNSSNASTFAWTLNILDGAGNTVPQDTCGTVAAQWSGPANGNSASGTFAGPAPCAGFSYKITYIATNSAGVSATAQQTVAVTAAPPPPPAAPSTSCSLTSNLGTNPTITQGASVTWTASSTPAGLPFFWFVSGPTNQTHVSGGSTVASSTYAYSTPATYSVYFNVENSSGVVLCTSNTATLIVQASSTPPASPPPPPPPPAPPSFDFSLSNQGDQSVIQGNSVNNVINATLVSGTSQSVSYSVSGLPAGVTSSFTPTACSPTCSTTLTLSTGVSTPTGTYPITVTGTGGGISRTTSFNLTISVLNNPGGGGGGNPTGSLTVCLMLADVNLGIATNSAILPPGLFIENLSNATGTLQTKTWNTTSFSPNKKVILSSPDADCITYGNLPLGTYNYSQLAVTGSLWNVPKYNDQTTQAINNTSDFFPYGTNSNSTGSITLVSGNANRTLVMFDVDNAGQVCPAPQVTSALSATATQGQPFTYTLTASSTTATSFSVSGLPAGLSFSANQITGTPTQTGTFNITLNAVNQCIGGVTIQTLVLTVNAPSSGGGGGGGGGSPGIGSGNPNAPGVAGTPPGGGGGGGGGNGPVNPNSLTIFNEQVVEPVSGTAVVSWNTNLPATRRVVYDTVSHSVLDAIASSSPNLGYAYTTATSSELLTAHQLSILIDSSKTYYFREISTASSTTGGPDYVAVGKEVVLNPQGQIATTTSGSCYYLHDFLRKDFNNDPQEVTKLQLFLRDIEGYNVQITGVYDDQTIAAVNAFQVKYKEDVLIPWGYDGTHGTSYVYLLTRKKVNEIYCGTVFPLTPDQQQEVTNYRNFFLGLKQAGIQAPLQNQPAVPITPSTTTTPENVVGQNLPPAGPGILSRLYANVLYALGFNSCSSVFCGWFNLILLIIILILAYVWYREYRNHKKMQKANEEIDLNKDNT